MGLVFTKMQGLGNDYVYLQLQTPPPEPAKLAVWLSNRHRGVGSDGLVLILPSERADFAMRIFNADGSEAEMCGTAARCVGKYVYERGLTQKTGLTLETRAGLRRLELAVSGGRVTACMVDMGCPRFEAALVPALWPGRELIERPLCVQGRTLLLTAVSVGNPHCVCFCEKVGALPLRELGAALSRLPVFPAGVNAEFVSRPEEKSFLARVWERGSGETQSCGTGACAIVAAAVRTGRLAPGEEAVVAMPGGVLRVVQRNDGHLYMTGPAEFSFLGEMSEDDPTE